MPTTLKTTQFKSSKTGKSSSQKGADYYTNVGFLALVFYSILSSIILVIPRSLAYEMGRLNRTKMLVLFCVFHLFMLADTQIAS